MAAARKNAFIGSAKLNAGETLQIAKIEEGNWNRLVPKNVTLAAAFDEFSKIHHGNMETTDRHLGQDFLGPSSA